MSNIPIKDIKVNDSSYVDPNGFVFHYQGNLYRAINSRMEPFYRSLFAEGIINNLCRDFHLVSSEITDYTIQEISCHLVIKHQEIRPVTYCVGWCPSMLKKAARNILDLNLALLEYNCTLQDAYPWNILFNFTDPVFIDLTSIVPLDNRMIWPAYQQFLNYFLYPLKLASMGKDKIARLLLYDYINGVTLNDLNTNFSISYVLNHPLEVVSSFILEKLADKIQSKTTLKKRLQDILESKNITKHLNNALRKKFFLKLFNSLEKIKIRFGQTAWEKYYTNIDKKFDLQKKREVVGNILDSIKPRSVFDIGSNTGQYSLIAAQKGAQVIALDSSMVCIEYLFKKAETDSLKILPLIGDVINPTPSFGFLARQFPSWDQRLKSELILFLGIMHHLHINGRQSFARLAEFLNELSQKAVVFEYIDSTDNNICLLDHGRKIDYSLETVSRSLAKYFKLSFFDSDRKTRKIILCQK